MRVEIVPVGAIAVGNVAMGTIGVDDVTVGDVALGSVAMEKGCYFMLPCPCDMMAVVTVLLPSKLLLQVLLLCLRQF